MAMNNELFISVGIDVGADFSEMAIVLPNQVFIEKKTYRVYHNNLKSLETAIEKIKKAEETHSMKSRAFLESTGVYHFPLFCYINENGLDAYIVNPLITNSNKNMNIRKVKNDKLDARRIALIGLNPETKVSLIPKDLVLNLRNLLREHYNLSDSKTAYVLKLNTQLRMAFPQYLGIFRDLVGKASAMVLSEYTTPESILAEKEEILVEKIAVTSRKKKSYGKAKYDLLVKAAKDALKFGHLLDSNVLLIRQSLRFISTIKLEMDELMKQMGEIVAGNPEEVFIKRIKLLEGIKGVGFLSAVGLMCEIGDFDAFKKPKQLVGYFGIDPAVNQSGNYCGSGFKMSKRGSRIGRRILYTIALQFIGSSNGVPRNSVIKAFYLEKCKSKKKKVALGAVMRKVCNIIFAVLRDNKPYVIKTPEQHQLEYQHAGQHQEEILKISA